jgi:hypothetical protein
VVGAAVVGASVVGACVVGASVIGASVAGASVVGAIVVGAFSSFLQLSQQWPFTSSGTSSSSQVFIRSLCLNQTEQAVCVSTHSFISQF